MLWTRTRSCATRLGCRWRSCGGSGRLRSGRASNPDDDCCVPAIRYAAKRLLRGSFQEAVDSLVLLRGLGALPALALGLVSVGLCAGVFAAGLFLAGLLRGGLL